MQVHINNKCADMYTCFLFVACGAASRLISVAPAGRCSCLFTWEYLSPLVPTLDIAMSHKAAVTSAPATALVSLQAILDLSA